MSELIGNVSTCCSGERWQATVLVPGYGKKVTCTWDEAADCQKARLILEKKVKARMAKNVKDIEISPWGFPWKCEEEVDYEIRVTPAQAKMLLGRRHKDQRGLSDGAVLTFSQAIKDGHFVAMMEPGIWFDQAGTLVNAQHRLQAQIETGVTLDWKIKLGAPKEKIDVLDHLRSRRPHQSINLVDQEKMSPHMSATLRAAWRVSMGDGGSVPHGHQKGVWSTYKCREIRSVFGEAAGEVLQRVPKIHGTGPIAGALTIAWAATKGDVKVVEFCRAFVDARKSTGEKDHPATALAKFVTQGEKKQRGGDAWAVECIYETLAAVRSHIRNKKGIPSDLARQKVAVKWFQDQLLRNRAARAA